MDFDVLVVGAGPTGLTLACDLARRFVHVRIVDKASQAFRGSRGKGLQPRTLEVFEDLGVIDEVLAAGTDYPRLRIHVGPFSFPWRLMRRDSRTSQTPYPNAWLLPQARTEAILRTRLADYRVAVDLGCELRALTQDSNGVTAMLARRGALETVRARYLIGADGGHSAVRKLLGVAFHGAAIESPPAVIADVHASDLSTDAWHVWPRGKWGPVALCPLPQSDSFQLFAQVSKMVSSAPNAAALPALVREALGTAAPALRDPTWLSLYQPSARLAERFRIGRVLLAGDAAHVHPPHGGQGLNLGVQDAYNLGWKLAAALRGAPDALLDSYEEERRPVAAATLKLATDLTRSRWRRRGADSKQLRLNYRGSSVSGPGAGDRVRDASCLDPAGRVCRLFDLLRGPHATLLSFGLRAARTAARVQESETLRVLRVVERGVALEGAVIDHELQLRRSFGLRDDALVLIRPDGYVALIAPATAEHALRAALSRIQPSQLNKKPEVTHAANT